MLFVIECLGSRVRSSICSPPRAASGEQPGQFDEGQARQRLPEQPAPLGEQCDHCWGSSLHQHGLEQVVPERHEEHHDGQDSSNAATSTIRVREAIVLSTMRDDG